MVCKSAYKHLYLHVVVSRRKCVVEIPEYKIILHACFYTPAEKLFRRYRQGLAYAVEHIETYGVCSCLPTRNCRVRYTEAIGQLFLGQSTFFSVICYSLRYFIFPCFHLYNLHLYENSIKFKKIQVFFGVRLDKIHLYCYIDYRQNGIRAKNAKKSVGIFH